MNRTWTVLNVDDSADDIFLLEGACRSVKASFRLQSVRDGDKALAYLAGSGIYSDRNTYPFPDWVLLDLKLPKKSGFEILAWIRDQPGLQQLPVTIFSSSMFQQDVHRAYQLGANGFLEKQTSLARLQNLITAIEAMLATGRLPKLSFHNLPGYRTSTNP